MDASYNSTNRRYERGRVYVTDERHADASDEHVYTLERDPHERFNLNQYYNAVEDEQLYMDEYTSLIHRYSDLIMNSNTLFTRMEMTLRENITRAVARQTYYYHQSEHLYRRELRRLRAAATVASAPAVASAVASAVPSAPAPAPIQNVRDTLPRLLSRYISTENAREQRQNNNLFSMLYTVPVEIPLAAGAAARPNGPPTNEQINRATLNTMFANIISPVNATCPISRDEFNDESEITMIRGCNHIFNRSSLREWFAIHSTCPMCRGDIREYRPPSLQEPTVPRDIPRNISIDSTDRDHVTFSYDLPSNMNNEDMYRNLMDTVANMITNNQENQNRNNQNRNDIMDVD